MLETIETKRCVLRKISLDDAQAIFDAYAQDDEVTKYLSWSVHQSVQDTIDFMQRCLDRWNIGEIYTYVIIEKKSNKIIGSFDFRPLEKWASFGYVLAKKWRGLGYMTEVLSTMIDLGFSDFGFVKIIGYCDVDNIASAKVMEKSGMQFVAIEKNAGLLPAFGNDKRDKKMYEVSS